MDTVPKFEVFVLADVVFRVNRVTGETWRLTDNKWTKVEVES